jgi:hypothetical protein
MPLPAADRLRPFGTKTVFVVAVLFGGLVVLMAIAAGWFYSAASIQSTPTCVRYAMSLPKEDAGNLAQSIAVVAQASGLTLVAGDATGSKWKSKSTSLLFGLSNTRDEATLFVCAEKPRTTSWESVAKQFEQTVGSAVTFKEASLQLDDTVYHCAQHCYAITAAPVELVSV